MDSDPNPRVLHDQKEVDEYLASYEVCLPSKIEIKWCSPETDVTVSPPARACTSILRSCSRGEASHDSFCQGCLGTLQGPSLASRS